jgi:hypothetical protein
MIPRVGGAVLEYKIAEDQVANIWAARHEVLQCAVAVKLLSASLGEPGERPLSP